MSIPPAPAPRGAPVGLYLHHEGSGHRHRGVVLARELLARGHRVTGLGSGREPAGWPAAWVPLERDDDPAVTPASDPTAGGRLHWAPLGHPGLRARQAAVAAWIAASAPAALVVDVSQEVALLARLHGVDVVSVVLPGHRPDPAHAAGLGASTAVVGFWPPGATAMVTGLPDDVTRRVCAVGALSRYAPPYPDGLGCGPAPGSAVDDGALRVTVLAGSGGGADLLAPAAAALADGLPGARVELLGPGRWVEDPWPLIASADVVVCHAGQNAVAEVAAARRPAVVLALPRPFDEQHATAAELRDGGWPALVVDDAATADWPALVREAARLDGGAWTRWVDGGAAGRFADVVEGVVARVAAA